MRTETFTTAQASLAVLSQIRRLLDQAFQGEFSDDDWEHTVGGWHVVVTERDSLLAHASAVARTLEIDDEPFATGYVKGVATVPDRQREGWGSLVMTSVMELLRAEFELGALSTDRPAFYDRLGWERWRGPTFVRHGPELVRTHTEDDGVMVLRFGRSQDVDLRTSISCEARRGEDW